MGKVSDRLWPVADYVEPDLGSSTENISATRPKGSFSVGPAETPLHGLHG
jgi:hypothetical protein